MRRLALRFTEAPVSEAVPALGREAWLRAGVWVRRVRNSHQRDGGYVPQIPLAEAQPIAAVIIPCFNYGQFLMEAVRSALAQTLSNIEIVVVDDGSTDALTQRVLSECTRLPGVEVLRQENRGLSAARNSGISATTARYITCLDADDVMDPTYLEKSVTMLEIRKECGVAYPLVALFGQESGLWMTQEFDPALLLARNTIPAAAVFRREVWAALGGFDETMRSGCEDWDFWLRLASLGYRGGLLREPLIRHRRHGHNMTDEARKGYAALAAHVRRHATEIRRVRPRPIESVEPSEAFMNLVTTTEGRPVQVVTSRQLGGLRCRRNALRFLTHSHADSPIFCFPSGACANTLTILREAGVLAYSLPVFLTPPYYPAWLSRFPRAFPTRVVTDNQK